MCCFYFLFEIGAPKSFITSIRVLPQGDGCAQCPAAAGAADAPLASPWKHN